jgi:CRP-like cAMP-binding protein
MTYASETGNIWLDSLPDGVRAAMQRELKPLQIRQHQVVLEAGSTVAAVYFPTTCVLSVITLASDSQAVECAAIGYEGMAALSIFGPTMPNTRIVCQIAGGALAMPRAAFVDHLSDPDVLAASARFWERLFVLAGQSAACAAFHSAEQRLARWLLMIHDRVPGDELVLTQDFLATMLGVQRPTVTIAARILQAADIIHYRYGHVVIRNRRALEEASCDCYRVLSGQMPGKIRD